MIVISIIAMVAGGVTVMAFKHWERAKLANTKNSARIVREAVRSYWMTTGTDECPTIDALVSAEVIDEGGAKVDAWGVPWHITCEGSKVRVSSSGPDHAPETGDDISVP